MECQNCHFVAAPGQAAVEGTCPNCERPYRDQPTPLNSDMEMRDMPEPGMEDSGGNPLQEGILGDWQNRGVRDEAFASVKKPEPEFEVTQVIVPDPESIRPDKKQMDKQADFLDTLGDVGKAVAPVAGGLLGGAVGTLVAPGVGTAAGAALGAGLAGGGTEALDGGDAGDIVGTGLEDAALGGIGGGLAGAGIKGAETLGAMGIGTGAVEDAAAQGATKGGIGSLMKSAWGKVPTQRIKDAYLMNSVMDNAGGIAPQAPQPQQNMVGAPPPASFYSAVETPTSHGEIPSNNTDDPEEIDFNEKNDGEKDGLQSDLSINDVGGTDLGPDDFFSPDSGALSSFAELLPKILQFALGDQSAAGDPDMEELHQKLEAEKPGYMNSADDDHGSKIVMMIMKGKPNGEAGGDDALQDNDAPHDPISEHEASALRPGLETTCGMCGGVMDASVERCPQCGGSNGRHMPQPTNPDFKTPQQMMNPPMETTSAGATSQGPITDQQKAQVAELLQEEGRGEEVSKMIMEPWNYAAELSQITGREEPPQDIGQPGPPPALPPGGQEGSMPMPGMAPPGPQSGPSMMAAVKKYATSVDGFCEACPNCKSHTTGYLDYEGGKAGCKTCHHTWDAPKMVEHSAAGEDLSAAPVEPELSMAQPPEEAQEQEQGSLNWADESGSPLKVGQTYEMYSNNYDIPDRVTINAVKPDVIEYTLVGEYGLSHQTELTHEEASVEGTKFIPTEGGEELDQAPEEAGQGSQPVPGPGDQTDLSTPHEMMTSRTANLESPEVQHPLGPMTGGMGTAPSLRTNSHDVALAENYTPEVAAFFDDDPAPQGHEASIAPVSGGEETGPAWLMEDVPPSAHMAGAQMTPWEQRGFIDENGDARNADKLQLSGTHYEMDDLTDSFLFGL